MASRTARSPRRRPTEEVRARILEAARELFVAQGYRATTTKQIALRAGVVEPLIFSNFGTKANLFESTLVSPFSALIDDYVASWSTHPPTSADAEELVRHFVTGLFDLVRANRELLRPLIAAQVHGSDDLNGFARTVSGQLATALRSVVQPLVVEEGARFFNLGDVEATQSAVIGMILGVVLLDDWLFLPGSRRPGRARQIDAVCTLVLHGLSPLEPGSASHPIPVESERQPAVGAL